MTSQEKKITPEIDFLKDNDHQNASSKSSFKAYADSIKFK
jgi:hypothetical protein